MKFILALLLFTLPVSAQLLRNAGFVGGLAPASGDVTAPVITITSPTSGTTYDNGTSSSISLAGTASDVGGVTTVTWVNNRGGSGTATGTTSWTITGINLQDGANVITVTAKDAANNPGTDVLTVTATLTPPAGFYAAVNGTTISTTGSFADPWTLPYAFSGAGGRIPPGSTVYVRGGTYSGHFFYTVPNVIFRNYKNETPVLAGTTLFDGNNNQFHVLNINVGSGNAATVWGFEIKHEIDMTSLGGVGSGIGAPAPNGISLIAASPMNIRNCVIRNCGIAIGLFDARVSNLEMYGTQIYYTGNSEHDHHLYVQTKGTGYYRFRESLMWGVVEDQAISFNGGEGDAHDIEFTGCAIWANAAPSFVFSIGYSSGLFLNCTYDSMYGYFQKSSFNPQEHFYFCAKGGAIANGMRVVNNYFAGGNQIMDVRGFQSGTVTNNVLVANPANVTAVKYDAAWPPNFGAVTYNRNTYFGTAAGTLFGAHNNPVSYTTWKANTGWDANSVFATGLPATNHIAVRPNAYEAGRGHIIVYNWANNNNVNVDLSSLGLANGQAYRVMYAMNWKGNPVLNTTYNSGSPIVSLPTTNLTAEVPFRNYVAAASKTTTSPQFCVYIVVPTLP